MPLAFFLLSYLPPGHHLHPFCLSNRKAKLAQERAKARGYTLDFSGKHSGLICFKVCLSRSLPSSPLSISFYLINLCLTLTFSLTSTSPPNALSLSLSLSFSRSMFTLSVSQLNYVVSFDFAGHFQSNAAIEQAKSRGLEASVLAQVSLFFST